MTRLLAFFILIYAGPALADRRIETIFYTPDRVIGLAGHKAIQTMIEFGADEHIENIALGDSAGWQVTPNKRANLIFVKPLMAHARTNMTVVTDRRRYLFDLFNARARSRPIYALRFIYPEPVKLAVVVEPAVVKPLPPPLPINTNWQAKGDKRLIPARMYDDTVNTYIAWSDTTDLPAVLVLGTDGIEGPVNYTAKGDYLVVEGVAPRYVLRIGKASAVMTNLSPAPPRPVAPTATTTDVEKAK